MNLQEEKVQVEAPPQAPRAPQSRQAPPPHLAPQTSSFEARPIAMESDIASIKRKQSKMDKVLNKMYRYLSRISELAA
ncbi:hypothetical protein MRB53_024230 [Persea americana]|uniref:Uncharacterized protein n=1 Tax=Persea americana TaxID=3435 RepID=A0ACC2LC32_PERAE|nr:hypothetical protein MRB53_024230 [Persea americana]